jgi:parallel beta-helix repeat protein
VLVGALLPWLAVGAPPAAPARMIDVRSLGARGDGRTDDTAAIQAAVDLAAATHGVAYVPSGTYRSGPIALPSGATLSGEGYFSTIVLKGGAKDHLLSPKDRAGTPSVADVVIRNLHLIGRSAQQNGGGPMPLAGGKHGVAILGGRNWTVQGVIAEDFDGDGIYLGRNFLNPANAPAENNLVEGCTVLRNMRNGMMISHGRGNIIRNNVFERNQVGILRGHPKYAPRIYRSAELDIEPNTFRFLESATGNLIEHNTFSHGHGLGIQITRPQTQVSGNVIRDNTFIDNEGGQILLRSRDAQHNIIAGNRFVASSPSVMPFIIRIADGSYNSVRDNVFIGGVEEDGSHHAIMIDEPDRKNGTGVHGTEFSGNQVDFRNSFGAGAAIFFGPTTQDSIISGNTLLGASFLIRGSVEPGSSHAVASSQ